MNTVDCLEVAQELERWTQSFEQAIRELLQFVLGGKTYGNLTPSLIEPKLPRQFIAGSDTVSSDIILDHPTIQTFSTKLNSDGKLDKGGFP